MGSWARRIQNHMPIFSSSNFISVKVQIENISGFAGHMVYVMTTQLSLLGQKPPQTMCK